MKMLSGCEQDEIAEVHKKLETSAKSIMDRDTDWADLKTREKELNLRAHEAMVKMQAIAKLAHALVTIASRPSGALGSSWGDFAKLEKVITESKQVASEILAE